MCMIAEVNWSSWRLYRFCVVRAHNAYTYYTVIVTISLLSPLTYLRLGHDASGRRKALNQTTVHRLRVEVFSMLYDVLANSRWHRRTNILDTTDRRVSTSVQESDKHKSTVPVNIPGDTSAANSKSHPGMQTSTVSVRHLMLRANVLTANILERNLVSLHWIANASQIVRVAIARFNHSDHVQKECTIIHEFGQVALDVHITFINIRWTC